MIYGTRMKSVFPGYCAQYTRVNCNYTVAYTVLIILNSTRWRKYFGQSGNLFTNNLTNRITKKTTDLEDSAAQIPQKWMNEAKAVEKIV